MKKQILPVAIFATLIMYAFKTNAQWANQYLSNLISPTSVNQSLLVDKDNAHNIGSISKAWKNIYLDTAIYIDGVRFIAYRTSTGDGNTAIGKYVLYSDVSGYSNTGVGYKSLYYNTTGYQNTAMGRGALYRNTSGDYNTAVGYYALFDDTDGTANTAFGQGALQENTHGGYNTALGEGALGLNTTGSFNVAVGQPAGYNVTTGEYNTFVGYLANCGSGGTLNNSMALGNQASVTASNTVRIGNSSVTSIGGYVDFTKISDGRVKKSIKQNVPGLAFINKLQPITYNLNLDAADKIMALPEKKDRDGKAIQPSSEEMQARNNQQQIVYTGFVAQDVEKAAQSLNYDFSGVDKPGNANTLYGLRYSEFVVPLVKAVQELSAKNDELEQRIAKLEAMMNVNQSTFNGQQSTALASASLQQNIPNPFNSSTTINYSLPARYSSAKIIITDKNGTALKQVNLSNNKGNISVDAATLTSGAYQYALYVDGKMITSKQMEIIK